ncbi:MAG: hypothetical protein KDD63_02625 [Bacteroidetes bacterium]|nr:hypothetical protein [Bacteroidota bacterium]
MSKPIKFSQLALENTLEIHENLEEFKDGLGDRFYDKLREIYELIKNGNEIFQFLDEDKQKRRAILKLTKRLHFRIIYEVLPDYVEIQAIKSTYQKR